MTGREARTWVSSWSGRWAKETGAGWALTIDDALVGQISFVLEGTMLGEALHADGWHDMHLHARLSGDAR